MKSLLLALLVCAAPCGALAAEGHVNPYIMGRSNVPTVAFPRLKQGCQIVASRHRPVHPCNIPNPLGHAQ